MNVIENEMKRCAGLRLSVKWLWVLVTLIAYAGTHEIHTQDEKSPVDVPKVVPTAAVVRAFVYFEDTGRPVKRTSVMLLRTDERSGPENSGVTDNNGKIEFRNVRAGKYLAVVNAPGVVSPLAYANVLSRRDEMLSDEMLALPAIFVDGLSEQEIQIPARKGGAISGRVTYPDGDPAVGVSVAVLRKVGENFVPTIPNLSAIGALMMGGAGGYMTDDRGVFRFAGLPAGEYLVKVTENVEHSKKGPGSERDAFASILFGSSSMVSVFFKDAFEQKKAELVKVEFGQEIPELNIVLPERELKKLKGKVVAVKDKFPVRNARVTIKREGERTDEEEMRIVSTKVTYSDNKGEWEFLELPTGKYSISVQAENSEFDETAKAYGSESRDPSVYYANYANMAVANAVNAISNAIAFAGNTAPQKPPARKFAKRSIDVEINEKEVPEQTVELSHGSVISGTISVEKGESLPTSVEIVNAGENEESGAVSTSVYGMRYEEAEGDSVAKKSADFVIDAVPSGKRYTTVRPSDGEFYVKSATAGDVDLLAGPIDIKEGEDIRNVKIVLAKDVGTVKGLIVDESTKPLPRYDLTFVPTDRAKMRNSSYYRHVRSNDQGEFEVKLPPFEYSVLRFPKNLDSMSMIALHRWLGENIKDAQTLRVEAGKSQSLTVKRKAEPTKP